MIHMLKYFLVKFKKLQVARNKIYYLCARERTIGAAEL